MYIKGGKLGQRENQEKSYVIKLNHINPYAGITFLLFKANVWMAMHLNFKFRFHIGILNQHWLVEQGRRPMTDWPATVAPK